MEQLVFGPADATRELWDLSDRELANGCRLIAEGRLAHATRFLRAESMRLFLVWMETLQAPNCEGEQRERRAALLSGLRKRTIQLLVKLSLLAHPLTHER